MKPTDKNFKRKTGCFNRREFLFTSGIAVSGSILLPALPGISAEAMAAETIGYPRMKIGRLSKLKANEPVYFNYPDDGGNSTSILLKLGEKAGGGVGQDGDVVAFNILCTHMGGELSQYQAADKALGPCPFHQSTFDLTRHGMIISGHATESLPQVLLELEGDDIIAVGLLGLIYGRHQNLS